MILIVITGKITGVLTGGVSTVQIKTQCENKATQDMFTQFGFPTSAGPSPEVNGIPLSLKQ